MPLHLTFDDGPDPVLTPRVLRALESHGAQATFFVLGPQLRAAPSLLAEVQRQGHRVELHGEAHLDHRRATRSALEADTDAALATLAEQGVSPAWWRLPWGRPGAHSEAVAAQAGVRIAGWDHDTHDWRGDGPIAQRDELERVAREGGVVLMHDGFGPGATRATGHNTLDLVDALLRAAARHGTPARALPDPGSAEADAIPAGPGQAALPEPPAAPQQLETTESRV